MHFWTIWYSVSVTLMLKAYAVFDSRLIRDNQGIHSSTFNTVWVLKSTILNTESKELTKRENFEENRLLSSQCLEGCVAVLVYVFYQWVFLGLWLVIVNGRHSYRSSKPEWTSVENCVEQIYSHCIVGRIFIAVVNDVDHYLASPAELHRAEGESGVSTEWLMDDVPHQPPMRTIPGKSDITFMSISDIPSMPNYHSYRYQITFRVLTVREWQGMGGRSISVTASQAVPLHPSASSKQ